MADQVSLSDLS